MKGGEMSKKDWKAVGAVAAIGGAMVAWHGITSKRWQTWHTVFVIAAALAAIGPQLD
jgi:hypothetical protein